MGPIIVFLVLAALGVALLLVPSEINDDSFRGKK